MSGGWLRWAGCVLTSAAGILAPFVGATDRGSETERWGPPSHAQGGGEQLTYTDGVFEAQPVTPGYGAAPERSNTDWWAWRPLWQHRVYGDSIGQAGLVVVDLDGDGQNEIVAGSTIHGSPHANNSWMVLRRSQSGSYDVAFRGTPGWPVVSIAAAQVDRDRFPEIAVATGAMVQVYDGLTLALQGFFTAAGSIGSMAVADADGDGGLDYVLCVDASKVLVYGIDGTLEYSAALPCVDVAVAQVDDDPAPEIVVANDGLDGYVVDGVTHALEWTNPLGFGRHVRAGDLDGDGRAEVVAGYYGYSIRIFDVELHSLKASIALDTSLAALHVADVEGDGTLEIVYGGQFGEVHVVNGATQAPRWSVVNPLPGVTNLALGDVDGIGAPELLWGAGFSSMGPDRLYVVDTVTRTIRWASPDIVGPFTALDVAADVGSLRRAVVAGSRESASGYRYGEGRYSFHDVQSGRVLYTSRALFGHLGGNAAPIRRVRAAQIDSDPQTELILAFGPAPGDLLICMDSQTHTEEWRAALPTSHVVGALALGDVDLDGRLEVVVGVRVSNASSPAAFVYIFDATTGAFEWRSPSLENASVDMKQLRVVQIDSDPQPEILVLGFGSRLHVLDRVAQTTVAVSVWPPQTLDALETADTDGDGLAEVFVVAGNTVQRISPSFATLFTESGSIYALAIGDLDGDGRADYATIVDNRIRIRQGPNLPVLWTSEKLASPDAVRVGIDDSLLIADVDGQSTPELVVNLGYSGFEVLTRVPALGPPSSSMAATKPPASASPDSRK